MRILFYFDYKLTYISHSIALYLKQKYGIKNFSGLVAGRKYYEFLQNQNEINYEYLKSVNEIYKNFEQEKIDKNYLSSLEKKYGIPNLWPIIYSDRAISIYNDYKYTHEDYLKLIQRFLYNIEDLINKSKPDYVIFFINASLPSMALYCISKYMNTPSLIITNTRTYGRYSIARNPYTILKKVNKTYDKFLSGYKNDYKYEAIKFINKFRNKSKNDKNKLRDTYLGGKLPISYHRELKERLFLPFYLLYKIYNYYREYNYNKNDHTFKNRGLIKTILKKVNKKINRLVLDLSHISEEPDYSENYAFFPLHYEPEYATMVLAPFYINQLTLIKNIAKSLPIEYKLYVKEHPVMYKNGPRPLSYYRKIKEIPNVRLINPLASSYDMIKKSRLVFTITGTAGWEALILKKPVFTFGKVFYNKLDLVNKVDNITELPFLVRKVLKNYEHDEKKLISFISAIFKESFQVKELGYLIYGSDQFNEDITNHEQVKIIAEALYNEMNIGGLD